MREFSEMSKRKTSKNSSELGEGVKQRGRCRKKANMSELGGRSGNRGGRRVGVGQVSEVGGMR